MNTRTVELAAEIINAPLPFPSEANGTYDELRERGWLRSPPVRPKPVGDKLPMPPRFP